MAGVCREVRGWRCGRGTAGHHRACTLRCACGSRRFHEGNHNMFETTFASNYRRHQGDEAPLTHLQPVSGHRQSCGAPSPCCAPSCSNLSEHRRLTSRHPGKVERSLEIEHPGEKRIACTSAVCAPRPRHELHGRRASRRRDCRSRSCRSPPSYTCLFHGGPEVHRTRKW